MSKVYGFEAKDQRPKTKTKDYDHYQDKIRQYATKQDKPRQGKAKEALQSQHKTHPADNHYTRQDTPKTFPRQDLP
jgi:hypothetical protein